MEQKTEETTPHNPVVEETPKVVDEVIVEPTKVELSSEELEDLKRRAEVSSQNFERLKKAELELKELRELQDNQTLSEYDDDTTKKLKTDIQELKQKVAKSEVLEQYPMLKDIWNEFETFRTDEDNKGMNLKTSAKAFLTEKGILEPLRKGLEKTKGGSHEPLSTGMSNDDVKKLRETDFNKYRDMLKKGQIKIS